MKTSTTITVDTSERSVHTITAQVQDAIDIQDGLCLVYCPHTTAALTVNEDEGGLKQDLLDRYDDLFPPGDSYQHDRGAEDNAHAHLKNMALGADHVLPVQNGTLQLGTWQDILLVENDGPRSRTVQVHCLGE